MELKGAVQTYAWGKVGKASKAVLLHSLNDSDFVIKDELPYAELWMGTHCNGPSTIKHTGQNLQDWILNSENCLGKDVIKHFGKELPFLFKVLSVNKALSVQAHPAKSHAEELYKLHPEIYKDPNHKPELAIALTPFEALCGFRPMSEIKKYLTDIPQLEVIIGKDLISTILKTSDPNNEKEMLKKCFQKLMTCPRDIVAEQLQAIIKEMETSCPPCQKKSSVALGGDTSQPKNLLRILHSQFPGDVGCFCVFFLNHITLNPGESIYLGPNVPHAYLSGDCIECMSCSDNVVRAGLTPKFRDVETLCEMLTYECISASSTKFSPLREDEFTLLYQPGIRDFAVANITIPGNSTEYTTIIRNSASILLVVEGEGEANKIDLKEGSIFFLPAEEQLVIKCKSKLNIYQAFANV